MAIVVIFFYFSNHLLPREFLLPQIRPQGTVFHGEEKEVCHQ